jgi:hypothetical protein
MIFAFPDAYSGDRSLDILVKAVKILHLTTVLMIEYIYLNLIGELSCKVKRNSGLAT